MALFTYITTDKSCNQKINKYRMLDGMSKVLPCINDIAKNNFGIDALLPVQRLVIYNILSAGLAQKDDETDSVSPYQLIILPTGTGKSVCFQLPILVLPGLTVIVYPLISLINDQIRRLSKANIISYRMVGGMSKQEKHTLVQNLENKSCACILTNPESLAVEQNLALLAKHTPTLLVIDEAHCISKWGKTFRPSYTALGEHIAVLQPKIITAFTATASDTVIADITHYLFLDETPYVLKGYADRPNITYSVLHCVHKDYTLATLLSTSQNIQEPVSLPPGQLPVHASFANVAYPVLIFCTTRKECRRVAMMLRDILNTKEVYFYHAGLSKQEKVNVEHWFLHSDDGVLVATCAYGMGIDKPNIRTVIHTNAFTDIENYLQETGRAGRDKSPSTAIMLADVSPHIIEQYCTLTTTNTYHEHTVIAEDKQCYTTLTTCRRAFLLNALEMQCEHCAGCDVCQGVFPIVNTEIFSILYYIAYSPRRYDIQHIIHIMQHNNTPSDIGNAILTQNILKWLLQYDYLTVGKILYPKKLSITRKGKSILNKHKTMLASNHQTTNTQKSA